MADNRTPAPNETAPKGGDKPAGTIDPNILSEDQLADERMGRNSLQAKDQEARHNGRKPNASRTRTRSKPSARWTMNDPAA